MNKKNFKRLKAFLLAVLMVLTSFAWDGREVKAEDATNPLVTTYAPADILALSSDKFMLSSAGKFETSTALIKTSFNDGNDIAAGDTVVRIFADGKDGQIGYFKHLTDENATKVVVEYTAMAHKGNTAIAVGEDWQILTAPLIQSPKQDGSWYRTIATMTKDDNGAWTVSYEISTKDGVLSTGTVADTLDSVSTILIGGYNIKNGSTTGYGVYIKDVVVTETLATSAEPDPSATPEPTLLDTNCEDSAFADVELVGSGTAKYLPAAGHTFYQLTNGKFVKIDIPANSKRIDIDAVYNNLSGAYVTMSLNGYDYTTEGEGSSEVATVTNPEQFIYHNSKKYEDIPGVSVKVVMEKTDVSGVATWTTKYTLDNGATWSTCSVNTSGQVQATGNDVLYVGSILRAVNLRSLKVTATYDESEEPVYAAQIKETSEKYETLDAALAAVTDGQTVELLANATLPEAYEGDSSLDKAFTIDLKGFDLTSDGIAWYTTNAIDTVGTGTLLIGEGTLLLPKYSEDGSSVVNPYLPVWNGNGYSLTAIEFGASNADTALNATTKANLDALGSKYIYFVTEPSFSDAVNTLLKDGASSEGFTIGILLEWTDANGDKQDSLAYYGDSLIQQVYEDGLYGTVFNCIVKNLDDYPDITATPVVYTHTGNPESGFDTSDYVYKRTTGLGVNN